MILDNFLSYMLADLPGCPDPTAKQALLLAAAEFCRETHCWDEVQDPITLVAGQREYDLDGVSGGKCFVVREVWINARRLKPITMQELQLVMPNWPTLTSNDPLYYNAAFDRSALSVYPTPDGTGAESMVIRAVYTPNLDASSLPDFLGERHMEALCSGAKARLMATPGQTYSRPDAVSYHREIFMNGIASAKAEMFHDRVQGAVTVMPRSFI